MMSNLEENLSCSVCRDIFREPVFLTCSHSFCKSCLQSWWAQKRIPECPLCKGISPERDPPVNVALKNVCEAFLQEQEENPSTKPVALCNLHFQTLKFFCLDDQQLLCATCLRSGTHNNHRARPIHAAARHYREVLQGILAPLQEKLELLGDIKRNYNEMATDIEVQAQVMERQIEDVFATLKKLLKKEKQTRISAVIAEKEQKRQTMRNWIEALRRDIAALSNTVRTTEKALQAQDVPFLQKYKMTAQTAQHYQPEIPQPLTGALIDMDKHLKNLPSKVLDSMKNQLTYYHNFTPFELRGSALRSDQSRLRAAMSTGDITAVSTATC